MLKGNRTKTSKGGLVPAAFRVQTGLEDRRRDREGPKTHRKVRGSRRRRVEPPRGNLRLAGCGAAGLAGLADTNLAGTGTEAGAGAEPVWIPRSPGRRVKGRSRKEASDWLAGRCAGASCGVCAGRSLGLPQVLTWIWGPATYGDSPTDGLRALSSALADSSGRGRLVPPPREQREARLGARL